MVSTSLIGLDLIGEMHALKIRRVLNLNDFGADLSYEVPSVKSAICESSGQKRFKSFDQNLSIG